MTKNDIAAKVHEKLGGTRVQAEASVNAIIETLIEELTAGHAVMIKGLGLFKVKDTKPRRGRNPKTGEKVNLPAGRKLSFKPANSLKSKLNTGRPE